jgi:hypothetical protein
MKIYLPQKKNMESKILDPFLIKKDTSIKIYSDNGLFKYHKNRFVQIHPIDKTIEKITINEQEFLLDSSHFKLGKEQFQIPFNHFLEKLDIYIYKLRKNALIELILMKSEDQEIVDWYFLTKEDIITIKEDIDTFLSLLN